MPLTYEELRYRCGRIVGLSPDATAHPIDCVRLLAQFTNNSGRGLAAEMLAQELAEYVHDQRSAARERPE